MTARPAPDHAPNPAVDRPEEVAPGVWRLVAPNPSPWTATGTNTYILDGPALLLVDPGPDDDRHLAATLAALAGRPLAAIVVTHSHLDHSGLTERLKSATGAPVLAFGDSRAGVRPRIGDLGGGAGVDRAFTPDRLLAHGERLEAWGLTAIHTPGHMGNHLCLDRGDVCLTGDQAMGWATSLVSPPEGDMGDYVASLHRLLALGPRRLLPGHGAPVTDGAARLRALLTHRRDREAEVLAALSSGPATAGAIAGRMYAGLPAGLAGAATRTVLAHLIDLDDRAVAKGPRPLSQGGLFRLRQPLDSPATAR